MRPEQGVEGLDRTGRKSRDSLRKTAMGTGRDRAGTHTAIGLLRHRCTERQELRVYRAKA